jgi:DNA helicase-2/ATP-dependent DNA helicase PcrA
VSGPPPPSRFVEGDPLGERAAAVLGGLDPEQRAVAEAVRGPVCVLAGAGTGKTRAITHRIAYGALTGAMPPQQVLAVTFTARAAGEMRGRLRDLGVPGVQAQTFHAAALRQLRYFWPRIVGGSIPALLDSKARPLAAAASRCRVPADRAQLRDLAAEVEWAKVSGHAPEAYPDAATAAGREPPLQPAVVGRIYAAYEEVKTDTGHLDFEDLLLVLAAGLEAHRDVADEVRARYRHFVVDEYQDVNPLQDRLLAAWLGERDDLCVVGDASQTIYSFTGATPAYLLDFRRRFPGAQVVRLVRDYRSTPQVVALANRVLDQAAPGPAREARVELVGQQPAGPVPRLHRYADEVDEAEGVAADIQGLIRRGVAAAEIAVLFRINAQSEAYEQALADFEIPYLVRGGERFFERAEVRQAMRLLRGQAAAAEASGDLVRTVTDVLASTGWTPQPPTGSGAVRERWEQVRALVSLAEDAVADDSGTTLGTFVADLEDRAAHQHVPTVDGVTLASLHAAKGLEWEAVFLVGLVEGTLPIVHARTPDQLEEERRLLYVGITRARRHLSLSWSAARSPGGRATRSPSHFLAGTGLLPDAGPAVSGTPRPRRGSAAPARCRVCGHPLRGGAERKLGRCSTCPADVDEALFERLREWRLATARAQSQPAFVVFTDSTLTAIAERRPGTPGELAAIPGVGPAKLGRFGSALLSLVSGAAVDEVVGDAAPETVREDGEP